ncbi:hypothetical protein N0B31_19755 [Salinirubellus salinus]|uniref:CopG family transcriptional regulator n=1 Tax=Salinirubellus salinus TaxID=1364945 RepID=A0A9E7R463_9EURY|nr:hypothetical protein [Salinirubellus salinus]UWM54340.1 hypothetical protein N0B31_19755 [Salinirubellus salinus]
MTAPTSRHEMADEEETQTVEIPASLAASVERRLAATQFESTDAYVTFCMTRLLRELEREEAGPPMGETAPSDEEVRDRLESLGYL